MEHRYAKRFPTHLKSLIFRSGLPIAIGSIRNFSRDGVFIETEFLEIDINQPLEIEIIARGGSRSPINYGERRLCKAIVMHKANGGLGLLIREDCAATQKHFAAIVAEELAFSRTAVHYQPPATGKEPISVNARS